jgi:hypothetical protein
MRHMNIFGHNANGDPADAPSRGSRFGDDVVGRLRSGYTLNGRPQALTAWRVTTGDPEVAEKIHDLLGGDAPQEWEAKGEDNLEVFTASPTVGIILEGVKALRQKMVLWNGQRKLVYSSDGQIIDYPEEKRGEPDPDGALSFQERKAKARDGIGAEPQIEVYFRLVGEEDLGIFKFQTGSWSMASDLGYNDTEGQLEEIDGPALAKLTLEEVSFVAKNGPRAGQTVNYTKPVLSLHGPAVDFKAAA